jgi:hypothetical protein
MCRDLLPDAATGGALHYDGRRQHLRTARCSTYLYDFCINLAALLAVAGGLPLRSIGGTWCGESMTIGGGLRPSRRRCRSRQRGRSERRRSLP